LGFQHLWERKSRDIVGPEMSRDDFRKGVAYGVAAYGMWGLIPIYFKALSGVPALEVLAHRIVWSVVLLVPLVLLRGQWSEFRRVISSKKTLATLVLTTVLIAVNWYLFIWAVDHGRVLEASLGYFINPLINVMLGMVFLGEKLSRPAAAAVVLAGLGVSVQVVMVGELPWIALALAFSFGIYGLLRKTAAVGAVVGLAVETSMLMVPATGYLVWARWTGGLYLGSGDLSTDLLLVLAGAVTAAPLLCFTSAARLLPLTTLGFLQYLAPSGQFLLAVLAYGEVLNSGRIITFICIWLALGIFTTDQLRRKKKLRPASS
jgi:chloramphenicol-sensitive protein RarD